MKAQCTALGGRWVQICRKGLCARFSIWNKTQSPCNLVQVAHFISHWKTIPDGFLATQCVAASVAAEKSPKGVAATDTAASLHRLIILIKIGLFYFSIFSARDAHILVKSLLDHFIKHQDCPPELLQDSKEPVSFLYGITAAVAGKIYLTWGLPTRITGGQ